jgi:hypothetical protein
MSAEQELRDSDEATQPLSELRKKQQKRRERFLSSSETETQILWSGIQPKNRLLKQ